MNTSLSSENLKEIMGQEFWDSCTLQQLWKLIRVAEKMVAIETADYYANNSRSLGPLYELVENK